MTCTFCHKAKVKCDQNIPCERCLRLGKECIPHVSRQGKRKQTLPKRPKPKESEDANLSYEVQLAQPHADHYGVQSLIRHWIAFAFRRRSFSLLGRASAMATASGITMDQIFNESATARGMDFLYQVLLTPTEQQEAVGPILRYDEVPTSIWFATNCPSTGNESYRLGNRWIWVREMKKGVSRFFASPAFERDIVTAAKMTETYRENKTPVIDLILPPAERFKHTRAVAHQISLHPRNGMPFRTTVLQDVNVMTKAGVVKANQANCIGIVDLDHSFFFGEYILQRKNSSKTQSSIADIDPNILLNIDAVADDEDLLFVLSLLE